MSLRPKGQWWSPYACLGPLTGEFGKRVVPTGGGQRKSQWLRVVQTTCRPWKAYPLSSPDMDATYRPMYSCDVPLDPLEMHMDMDGDYPIDTYSDGLRPPYPMADHTLA